MAVILRRGARGRQGVRGADKVLAKPPTGRPRRAARDLREASGRVRLARCARGDYDLPDYRVSGTKRTANVLRVTVRPSRALVITSNSCRPPRGPTGMTSRPPGAN